jgi:hypothetical protein
MSHEYSLEYFIEYFNKIYKKQCCDSVTIEAFSIEEIRDMKLNLSLFVIRHIIVSFDEGIGIPLEKRGIKMS